jgi:hypothetical protein
LFPVVTRALQGGMDRRVVRDAVMTRVRAFFKPEFLNRLDDIVVFDPLSQVRGRTLGRCAAWVAGLCARAAIGLCICFGYGGFMHLLLQDQMLGEVFLLMSPFCG